VHIISLRRLLFVVDVVVVVVFLSFVTSRSIFSGSAAIIKMHRFSLQVCK